MADIDERTAWGILRQYVEDCLQIDSASLIAVYAMGSLGGGYYRPGQSDIDAVLIVEDGSEDMWGTPVKASAELSELNHRYLETYQIPKDFGPFAMQERMLLPPYRTEDELVPEIARLKLQGKPVYGGCDLDAVPMPTANDMLAYVRHFETWFETEFLQDTPIETFSAWACVNTILMHLSRFLWIRRGTIEFDKSKVVGRYLANDPPFVDQEMIQLVDRSLDGHQLSEDETEHLRLHTVWLRKEMNRILNQGVSLAGGEIPCRTRFA